MKQRFHTVVVGGGCLGAASAISLSRKLRSASSKQVCLIEKAVLGAGLSSRHSAIVRSANASAAAAVLANRSTQLWKNLRSVWGVGIPAAATGAIWIAQDDDRGSENPWRVLEETMQTHGIHFQAVDRAEAAELTRDCMRLDPDEIFFWEPDVLQLDSADVLHALHTAVRDNAVHLKEHTRVTGFALDGAGLIRTVRTNHGDIECDHVVNATGGWSAELLGQIGLHLPVALEPVYAANWLVGASELPETLPIAADYVNRAYFRRWRGSILHMHQPRQRDLESIASTFGRSLMNPAGADVILDAANYAVTHDQLSSYVQKVKSRFPQIGAPVYAGGYVSFFDITPDLKFILGTDPDIANLVHCLGAGQALKYAPIFGELIAELVADGKPADKGLDLSEFSVARFRGKSGSALWSKRSSAVHAP